MIESIEKPQATAAISASRQEFAELSAGAPTGVERQALVPAVEALGSDQTRADYTAMASVGHELELAGLDVCGSMFISG